MRFSPILAILSNILCHFDRALFGLLAPFLAPLFFPEDEPIQALVYMYAMIPLGILSRCLGALIFGRLGDTLGREKIISLTLFGMGAKMAVMGCLPTFDQVGSIAPFLLIFSQFIFDFFSIGATTGSSIFLIEQSTPQRRNLVSSFFDASGILGILIASCAIWLTSSYDGFWRYLFWSGSLIGILGFFIRKIPLQKSIQIFDSNSIPKIAWKHKQAIFTIAAVSGISYANYYLVTTFMNGFLPLVSSITKAEAMSLNTFLLGLDMLLLPLFGLLSLKIKKEKLMLFSILGIMGCAIPLLLLLRFDNLLMAAAVRICFTVLGTCLAAPYHAWAFENTPSDHRYLVKSIGTLLGGKLLGTLFPMICLWLYQQTGSIISPAIPLILLGIMALIPFLRVAPLQQES